MRIICLIENTEGASGCTAAHGLSFYVETPKHKLLLDLGPSDETLRNAERLGIDLAEVDTVILSHGHYDHSGGILSFLEINRNAKVYMQRSATKAYYADDGADAPGGRYRYIGIDPRIVESGRVTFAEGDMAIDEELSVFTVRNRSHSLPFSNKNLLLRTGDTYIRDDFRHEHCLVISAEGKRVLLSGCAHNGILSILDAYRERYGSDPDIAISGFHLMKKTPYSEAELSEVLSTARELKSYRTKLVTCHCTGVPAYEAMKEILGGQLSYAHAGDTVL
jgi:7,8-dihydropterin-6-yl-methyl-4-(beta-D-ribofuranosyl)aminobenzene 5'-phosphate synthase